MRLSFWPVVFTGTVSLLLASCGGSGGTAQKATTTVVPTSSSTGRPSTSTSTIAGGVPCAADQLKGRQTTQGALGIEVGYITLENSAGQPCSMTGYVGFVPVGSNGASLPISVVHREGLNCTPPAGFCTRPGMGPPNRVILKPGDDAFFGFTYTGNPATGPDGAPYPCDQGVATSVSPPGATGSLTVAGVIDPCGPDYQVTISPIYSGPGPDGGRCKAKDLHASLGTVGPASPGASQEAVNLVYTNVSGSPCTLEGYPGFSLIGPPANAGTAGLSPYDPVRQAGTPSLIALAPGSSAHAVFTFLQGPDVCNTGVPWVPTSVKTIPPDETKALTVAWVGGPVDNCQGAATHSGTYIGPLMNGAA